MDKVKVLLGMSGGVDSSVAAYLLKESGFDVHGCTLKLYHPSPEETGADDIKDAAAVAEHLGISHSTADYTESFSSCVMQYFVNTYLKGGTPNPCTFCNKNVKFPCMADYAEKTGCDLVSTGHYARITKSGDRYLLHKGKDPRKDQSYMLYSLSQDILSKTVFPLGELTKEEIRKIAEDIKLPVASKKDSQDICFIKDGDYASFIKSFTGKSVPEGEFRTVDGKVIGKHKGIISYTVGQRKGLGISSEEPYYVVKKEPETNSVILGREVDLYTKTVKVTGVNFIPFDTLSAPVKVTAKLRYSQKESVCTAIPTEEGLLLEFDELQRAVTPGQSAVLYDGDTVVGGGLIYT